MSQHETATYRDGIISGGMAAYLGMRTCCPEFGTLACVDCELGLKRPLEMCDAHCGTCAYAERCPCTLCAWVERKEHTT